MMFVQIRKSPQRKDMLIKWSNGLSVRESSSNKMDLNILSQKNASWR
ncbi:hypothetical protein AVP43_00140 [Geobacillus stearothermophilus]|nr:hypothetical protein GARCT_00687 [Geobacillus sp. 12AMOR1]KZE97955.1 hypothetical protein AVP43_00140 [Geobacillus stearothermophilus]STO36336.1 Uncharacterised protein [[Flavobacterium] thermophilum]